MSKQKEMPQTYRVGDNELFTLFDDGEMEHICELINNCHDPVSKGLQKSYREHLAETLTTSLLPPLEILIQRLHETGRSTSAVEFEPTKKFITCIESVSRILAMRADNPCSEDETKELADLLRDRWTAFIAHASARRMYHDLPRELDKAKNVSKRQSVNAGQPRKDVSKEQLETFRQNYLNKKLKHDQNATDHGWKTAALIEFNIKDVRTLNKIIQ